MPAGTAAPGGPAACGDAAADSCAQPHGGAASEKHPDPVTQATRRYRPSHPSAPKPQRLWLPSRPLATPYPHLRL